MSNLIKLSDSQSTNFDYNRITDADQREAAITICTERDAVYEQLRDEATGILKRNTVNLAETVHLLKENLDHGNFTLVCDGKLNLSKDWQASLASVGKCLSEGKETDSAIEMLSQMEPRAAQKYFKADDDVKSRHVANFQQTGRVPSRRDYDFAKQAQQRKDLEANQNRQYVDAFSDCLENSCHDEDERKVVYAEVSVVAPVEVARGEVSTLSSIQDQLHQYLMNTNPLTDRDISLLKVIRNTIANYSMGKFKPDV